MDVTSTPNGSFQAENVLGTNLNSEQQKYEHGSEHIQGGSVETMLVESEPLNIEPLYIGQLQQSLQDATNCERNNASDLMQQLQQSHQDATNCERNNASDLMQQSAMCKDGRSAHYGSAVSESSSRKYTLRSSLDVGTSKNGPNTSSSSVHPSTEGTKRGRPRGTKGSASENEFLRIRTHCGYLLTRMSYEQSLIDAYSGEGWKGQSQDKVKPEKELERATSEILRCKLKMRDLFQHLDNLCTEGKLHESLFDSEGQIYSEDIFCAKCGSKDSSTNNDIILCDGICNRGFHQMCLVPPLLNEDIPPGDESWLCPGCVCKVVCIEKLNDMQGTKLSINDKWEKVFPEAATTAAGDKLYDELPSDDPEDDDYDPDSLTLDDDDIHEESSSSEESDFTSASDDVSAAPTRNEQPKLTGWSSDDSEDNDYDPNAPDIDEKIQNIGSSSDESDFTSASEDFNVLRNDGEASGQDGPLTSSGGERCKTDLKDNQPLNPELLSISETDLRAANARRIFGKRQHQHLDYKKLHDDYGNTPPDSSDDDDDWNEMNTPKKEKIDDTVKGKVISSTNNGQTVQNGVDSKIPESINDMALKPSSNKFEEMKNTSKRRIRQKLENKAVDFLVANPQRDAAMPNSYGRKPSTSGHKRIGREATQRLNDFLRLNNYPTRDMKEDLSKELGMTVQQVSRWFENARRSLRLSANRDGTEGESGTPNNVIILPYGK